MASTNQIREGIAANLASLKGIQNSAYLLSNATPPTLMLMPGPPGGGDFTEYHQAMGSAGLSRQTWTVRAEVAVSLDIGAQKNLDAFLDVNGGSSVKQAVEKPDGPDGRVTLGGLVSNVTVIRSVAGLVETRDGAQKLSAEWEVVVYT